MEEASEASGRIDSTPALKPTSQLREHRGEDRRELDRSHESHSRAGQGLGGSAQRLRPASHSFPPTWAALVIF